MADRQKLGSSGRTQGSRGASRQPEKWTETRNGKIVIAVLCLVALGLAIYECRAYLHGETPGDPNLTMYIDSQTGQTFEHRNAVGEMTPIVSPFTNQNTGYPAVACWWTADGQIKDQPTWVLMNRAIGKPGPTFCPDCGRLVNPFAPKPQPGDKPPPTRAELLHDNPAALGSGNSGK